MKKCVLFLCLCLLCTGCSPLEITQPGERLLIEAVGIDREKDGCKVSLQVLATGQSGNTDDIENPTAVLTGTGKTVREAIDQAAAVTGQKPMFGQMRLLVLGRKTALHSPGEFVDFFVREYTARDDIPVVTAEKTAEEIIGADIGKKVIAAQTTERILRTGEKNGTVAVLPLYRFVQYLQSDTDGAYAPVLRIQTKEDGTQTVSCIGTALFSSGKMTDIVSAEYTSSLLLLTDRTDTFSLTSESNGIPFSLFAEKTKIRRTFSRTESGILLSMQIIADCTLEEIGSASSNPEINLSEIRHNAERDLQNAIEKTVQTVIQEDGCDILRLGKRFHGDANNIRSLQTDIRVCIRLRLTGREIVGNG